LVDSVERMMMHGLANPKVIEEFTRSPTCYSSFYVP
jgi:hypothetical protein